MIRASGGFLCTSVISNKVHRQLCWNICSVNIVISFLYSLFHNCRHPLSFLKIKEFLDKWRGYNRVGKKSSPWRLFVHCVLN